MRRIIGTRHIDGKRMSTLHFDVRVEPPAEPVALRLLLPALQPAPGHRVNAGRSSRGDS